MPDRGDFSIVDAAVAFVKSENAERSAAARASDNGKRAPITTNAQRWASNPDDVDFPGVDTPRENPRVLPKDLKQDRKPRLSPEARNEAPTEPVGQDELQYEFAQGQAQAADVTISPEEAIDGVGATSSRAIGGFDSVKGRETDPVTGEPLFRDENKFSEDEARIAELDQEFR